MMGRGGMPAYTAIRSSSDDDSSGTGRPRSTRSSRQSNAASRTFVRASAFVSPWEMHPGKAGTSATQRPSSPGVNLTNRLVPPLIAFPYPSLLRRLVYQSGHGARSQRESACSNPLTFGFRPLLADLRILHDLISMAPIDFPYDQVPPASSPSPQRPTAPRTS